MRKWIPLSMAFWACGFPRPADVGPMGDGGIDSGDNAKTCMQTTCIMGVLEVCGTSGTVVHTEQCALGCFSDGSRCNEIVPSNGVGPSLDEAGQHGPITLPAGSLIDTDTGAVTAAGTPIPVTSLTVLQPAGPILRVFVARSWTINDVRVLGTLPAAFVASDEIKVQGAIDVSADADVNGPGALVCGSSAGGGGLGEASFTRPPVENSGGYPAFLLNSNGYGGGGFGTTGGAGGVVEAGLKIGAAGKENGNAELTPLRGGCEGGGLMPRTGGAGGGAVQLVAARAVHLVAGTSSTAVVHVGGGHGVAGVLGTDTAPATNPIYGPGGGGSGGGILIEAPSVILDDGISLLAGGGGGGGYGACTPPPDGVDAPPSALPAAGGACPAGTTPAAAGGAGATNGAGTTGANAAIVGTFMCGSAGSGGGGLGRIRINTVDGRYSAGMSSLLRGVTTSGAVGRR